MKDAAEVIRAWAERQRVLGLIDDKEYAVLIRCAEDLEAGHA